MSPTLLLLFNFSCVAHLYGLFAAGLFQCNFARFQQILTNATDKTKKMPNKLCLFCKIFSIKLNAFQFDLKGRKINSQRSCKPKPIFRLKKISYSHCEKIVCKRTIITLICSIACSQKKIVS